MDHVERPNCEQWVSDVKPLHISFEGVDNANRSERTGNGKQDGSRKGRETDADAGRTSPATR
jgi:hypothetical protein